ncbi:hypothetical protein CWE08_02820 [Aliidiomarina iranensis]|uniref:histidine kinase n=1 Tax=Aliidiomarina iranensis TaxID=1434071 RepID=A0A432W303_9GAMM|nr:sensor histidine kinase [Aliidiomarina iranensis]RUO23595.1 hypothetical protein CWE08_02820 [Aliidiomarina iranensis]
MPENTQKWSLSSRLNIIIAGIVALAMLLFSAVAILLVSDSERRGLANRAEALAQQLALQASNLATPPSAAIAHNLANNSPDSSAQNNSPSSNLMSNALTREQMELLFRGLAAHDFLEHVHLYTLSSPAAEPQLLNTYTATGRSALNSQSARIKTLPNFQFTADYLEIVQPIFKSQDWNNQWQSDSDLAGYIYLRASLAQVQSAHRRQVFTSVVAFIAVMLSVSLSVKFFARTMASSLERLSRTIAKASQDQSFNLDEDRDFPEEFTDVRLQVKRVLEKYRHEKRYAEHSAAQAQKANDELEAEVTARTERLSALNNKLTVALETLHSHQQQQFERDKLASFSDLINRIAHELATPIDASMAATRLVQEQQETVQKSLSTKALTEMKLSEYLVKEQASLRAIMANLSKCADLIRHYQEIVVLNRNDKPRTITLYAFIQRMEHAVHTGRKLPEHVQLVFRNITDTANKTGSGITRVLQSHTGNSKDTLKLRVLTLEQVLLEIIDHAIAHGAYKDASGTYQPLLIEVAFELKNNMLLVQVADNGAGIEPALRTKIFQPFVLSAPEQNNAGLALYQVFNWVTQLLNGDIECQSLPLTSTEDNDNHNAEHGTQFTIKIPTSNN